MSDSLLYLSRDDVRALAISPDEAREAVLQGFRDHAAGLNLSIPKGDPYSTLYINSEPYKYVESPKFTFSGIGPDKAGRFFYQKSAQSMNFQGGIAELTMG